jgi:hypothetical protein
VGLVLVVFLVLVFVQQKDLSNYVSTIQNDRESWHTRKQAHDHGLEHRKHHRHKRSKSNSVTDEEQDSVAGVVSKPLPLPLPLELAAPPPAVSSFVASPVKSASGCFNEKKDNDETDIDCGGNCPKCRDFFSCEVDSDCIADNCEDDTCTPDLCLDGVQNGLETDVDCGGKDCKKCPIAYFCRLDDDCSSGVCSKSPPAPLPVPSAGATSGLRTVAPLNLLLNLNHANNPSADPSHDAHGYGLVIPTAAPTTLGQARPRACVSNSSCSNGRRDTLETDIDCGGGGCTGCADYKRCRVGSDCVSTICANARCQSGTACDNGIKVVIPFLCVFFLGETKTDSDTKLCGVCNMLGNPNRGWLQGWRRVGR